MVTIARSRTERASRVERTGILLAYQEDSSFFATARALGVYHQTVQRCVKRALAYGPMAALDDRPRLGKEPTPVAKCHGVTLDASQRSIDGFGAKVAGLGEAQASLLGTGHDRRYE